MIMFSNKYLCFHTMKFHVVLDISALCYLLTLKEPSKIAADDTIYLFIHFFYLWKKISLDVSCESSEQRHEISNLIFSEKKKNSKLSCAAVVTGA